MRRKIPSTSSLQAFEAAARLLSFARAATELNLTPTAISHQIRSLEEALCVKLFVRDHNGIRLTSIGQDYHTSVRSALSEIATASERVNLSKGRDDLIVACLGTFAIKALIPNLWKFREQYPKIPLRIQTVVSYDNLLRHDYDVAIRHGSGGWPASPSEPITNDDIFPVCSPTMLESVKSLKTPGDLKYCTGIRTSLQALGGDLWPVWFEKADIRDIEFASEITCDLLSTTLQAAIEGLGVALGRSSLVARDLAAGALIEPFKVRIPSMSNYYMFTPPDRREDPKVRAFQDWILSKPF